ncbi:hypothetical protein SAMN05444583_12070 [Rhodococcus maanshanensis]|uniref:Uncharacterized protein n=1 Tax=Rhodococcus maanshanensis TaxID=183556 RepID=A0A1H7V3Q2_9NOCA|nr:hypothetical protein SAMN05444583_12070 [Rhodococcus maanshanensis]
MSRIRQGSCATHRGMGVAHSGNRGFRASRYCYVPDRSRRAGGGTRSRARRCCPERESRHAGMGKGLATQFGWVARPTRRPDPSPDRDSGEDSRWPTRGSATILSEFSAKVPRAGRGRRSLGAGPGEACAVSNGKLRNNSGKPCATAAPTDSTRSSLTSHRVKGSERSSAPEVPWNCRKRSAQWSFETHPWHSFQSATCRVARVGLPGGRCADDPHDRPAVSTYKRLLWIT